MSGELGTSKRVLFAPGQALLVSGEDVCVDSDSVEDVSVGEGSSEVGVGEAALHLLAYTQHGAHMVRHSPVTVRLFVRGALRGQTNPQPDG